MLKGLSDISKLTINGQQFLATDDSDMLSYLIEKINMVLTFVESINQWIIYLRTIIINKLDLFSESSYGKPLFILRSYLNTICRGFWMTLKYFVCSTYLYDYLVDKKDKYSHYYLFMTEIKPQNDSQNHSHIDSHIDSLNHLHIDSHIDSLNHLHNDSHIDSSNDVKIKIQEEKAINMMNDMMQNFVNIMQTTDLQPPLTEQNLNRKTRRAVVKVNGKNKKKIDKKLDKN
jgi:hypothetical protein